MSRPDPLIRFPHGFHGSFGENERHPNAALALLRIDDRLDEAPLLVPSPERAPVRNAESNELPVASEKSKPSRESLRSTEGDSK